MKILLPLSLASLLCAAGCQPSGIMTGSAPQTSAKKPAPQEPAWIVGNWNVKELYNSQNLTNEPFPFLGPKGNPSLDSFNEKPVKFEQSGSFELDSAAWPNLGKGTTRNNGSFHVSKGQLTITKNGVTHVWDIHRDSDTSFYLTEPGKTWPEVLMTRPLKKRRSNIDDTGAGPHLIHAA